MPNNKGTIGTFTQSGIDNDVVYVIWHTSDPAQRWFVTTDTKQRAILKSLIDRRPHPANHGYTQDAWTYEIVDEKTWLRMNAGGLPIPPKSIYRQPTMLVEQK